MSNSKDTKKGKNGYIWSKRKQAFYALLLGAALALASVGSALAGGFSAFG